MKAVDVHSGIDSTLIILQNRLKAKPDSSQIQIINDCVIKIRIAMQSNCLYRQK